MEQPQIALSLDALVQSYNLVLRLSDENYKLQLLVQALRAELEEQEEVEDGESVE